MAEPNLVIQNIGGVVIVNFGGSSILDAQLIEALGQRLYELVDQQAHRKLVLDFSKVQFLSSSVLGVLIKLQKKSAAIGGKVVLCGLKPELHKVFKISRMDRLFSFCADEGQALGSFGALDKS